MSLDLTIEVKKISSLFYGIFENLNSHASLGPSYNNETLKIYGVFMISYASTLFSVMTLMAANLTAMSCPNTKVECVTTAFNSSNSSNFGKYPSSCGFLFNGESVSSYYSWSKAHCMPRHFTDNELTNQCNESFSECCKNSPDKTCYPSYTRI